MTRVLSDMVAGVWKVEVTAGQHVSEGDVLMILESMKTEIPIEAPRDGVVSELRVVQGSRVAEGDVLAIIE